MYQKMEQSQAFFKKRLIIFTFVVSRWLSRSYAKTARAVCPKSLTFSYLEESIGELYFTLNLLAISIAWACVLAPSINSPLKTTLNQLPKFGCLNTFIILLLKQIFVIVSNLFEIIFPKFVECSIEHYHLPCVGCLFGIATLVEACESYERLFASLRACLQLV